MRACVQQGWVVFLLVLYFSRLGSLKLGRPHDQPEFPTASWFMMVRTFPPTQPQPPHA